MLPWRDHRHRRDTHERDRRTLPWQSTASVTQLNKPAYSRPLGRSTRSVRRPRRGPPGEGINPLRTEHRENFAHTRQRHHVRTTAPRNAPTCPQIPPHIAQPTPSTPWTRAGPAQNRRTPSSTAPHRPWDAESPGQDHLTGTFRRSSDSEVETLVTCARGELNPHALSGTRT